MKTIIKRSANVRAVIFPWILIVGAASGMAALEIGPVTTAGPETFTVELVLTSDSGRPEDVSLVLGTQPGATDGFDSAFDLFYPPPCPNCNFEAYFPSGNPVLPKLVRDIRSDQAARHEWTIIARGSPGTMAWAEEAFPVGGIFLLNGVTDMRQVATYRFASVETMSVIYNMEGAQPDIEIGTDYHDFGLVTTGSDLAWALPMKNTGDGDLIVNTVVSNRAEFSVASPGFPRGIPPAGSLEVMLRFIPQSEGLLDGGITVDCTDPDEATLYVALQGTGVTPEIEVSALAHDFGEVEAGASSEWAFEVSNSGTGTLMVSRITSDHPRFSLDPTAFSLSQGSSQRIRVTFSPVKAGRIVATASIVCNDPDEPAVAISLAGTGIAADIQVSATQHQFGAVNVGAISRWTLQVSNGGTIDLIVDTVAVTPAAFAVSPLFFTLAPGASCDVTVVFAPQAVQAYQGQMRLVSNDPGEPLLTIYVEGQGVIQAEPDIRIEKTGHDFGGVEIGTSAQWHFTVGNLGGGALVVDGISSGHPAFTVQPSAFSLGPGDSQHVAIQFAPATAGLAFTLIVVSSNDPDEPTVGLSVTGLGLPGIGVEDGFDDQQPGDFRLFQNRPNPFNASTEISYQIPAAFWSGDGTNAVQSPLQTRLVIYNVAGRQVRTLVNSAQQAGLSTVIWDGRDETGGVVSSGVYWYRLEAGPFVEKKMMVFLK